MLKMNLNSFTLKHNGCVIADSMGLGKTFEALAIIRYFDMLNYRVLVLCPKKLSSNWTIYQSFHGSSLNPFKKDKFNYTVLYHTDLGRVSGHSKANGIDLENFNWGAYDLIVIDESHNFKGNPLERVTEDGTSKMNRPKWLMEKIIKEGIQTKVLLLSATPVNNNLKDLRNQISLITEGNNSALYDATGIKDIALSLKNAQTLFTNWADPKKTKERSIKQLIERLDSSFFKLLDELTIARSRKHIKSFYKAEQEVGKFPIRNKPLSIYSNIDSKDLDNYINLKERVEARMALVDVTATADDNVLSTDQINDLIEDDLKYRNKQLKKLKKEILDLEDMDESISLTDFTLDDFRIELMNYIENNKEKLENAPFGLYAVVPSPSNNYSKQLNLFKFTESEREIIKPGVVFCLKQKGDIEGNEQINPLQPYFLVYIRDDGQVRFNYQNS